MKASLTRFRAMTCADRGLFLVLPTVLAVANPAFYYGYVLPMLTGESRPAYALLGQLRRRSDARAG